MAPTSRWRAATHNPNVGSTTPAETPDDRQRGSPSALFPPPEGDDAERCIADVPTRRGPAAERCSPDHESARLKHQARQQSVASAISWNLRRVYAQRGAGTTFPLAADFSKPT